MRFSHRTNIIPRLNRQAYHQGKGKEEVTKNRKKERGEREKVYLLFNFTKACNCCTVSMQCGPRSPIVSTCKERAGQKERSGGMKNNGAGRRDAAVWMLCIHTTTHLSSFPAEPFQLIFANRSCMSIPLRGCHIRHCLNLQSIPCCRSLVSSLPFESERWSQN